MLIISINIEDNKRKREVQKLRDGIKLGKMVICYFENSMD